MEAIVWPITIAVHSIITTVHPLCRNTLLLNSILQKEVFMKIKSNVIVLFIAGCLVSLVAFGLSELTKDLENGSPVNIHITQADMLYTLFAGIVFAVFMKTVNRSKQT